MKKQVLSLIFSFIFLAIFAQDKYWVSYKNKTATTYNIHNPKAFLSEKAIARRHKNNIAIKINDLPVCKNYTQTIESLGVEILNSSKWLNGSMLLINNPSKVLLIKNLNFVKSIQKLSTNITKSTFNKFNVQLEDINTKENTTDYGNGFNQINMLSGDYLHNLSFKGSGIEIAVMDNGFPSVDTNAFYQKANEENRIRIGWDFVNNDDTLYDSNNGNHGNFVISTMVSNIEGKFIGTAPEATYYLFSTEDVQNEGLAEEYNWAMAAEKADSLMGELAIITTSLGYSNGFGDTATNHTYNDMDGNTTPITIAADIAASKGFLVINSAGNEGANNWKYLTAPSDGDSVLAIGAVSSKGILADFSSRGPSFDGRIKPNVCAKGLAATGVTVFGQLASISGTSFSCPITAGMAACLWQAFPEKTNMEIFEAIEKSAHLYGSPNNNYGFGIPNFELAYLFLLSIDLQEDVFSLFPNPIKNDFSFSFKNTNDNKYFSIIISNDKGEIVSNKNFLKNHSLSFYNYPDISFLPKGIYYIKLTVGNQLFTSKFVKI